MIPSTSLKCSSSNTATFERIQSIRIFLSISNCLPLRATPFPEVLGDGFTMMVVRINRK